MFREIKAELRYHLQVPIPQPLAKVGEIDIHTRLPHKQKKQPTEPSPRPLSARNQFRKKDLASFDSYSVNHPTSIRDQEAGTDPLEKALTANRLLLARLMYAASSIPTFFFFAPRAVVPRTRYLFSNDCDGGI